jgi:hypothetical protein
MIDWKYLIDTRKEFFFHLRGLRSKYLFFSYNDWWQAKNLRTKQVGYVPANYISAINDLTACE